MGYDHYFHFIKDEMIDPNIAFIQNVDKFLFCIYFAYLESYESDIKKERNISDIKKERNILLAELFRVNKRSLIGGNMSLGEKKIKEILEEILKEDEMDKANRLSKLDLDLRRFFKYPHILDELIKLKYNYHTVNYAEMQVDLNLYCILVNGLDKTKGEKFDQIKEEMDPLIKILKEIFCEFDKNEIHKERTFIFPLRSPTGYHNDFYIINEKNILDYGYEDEDGYIKRMFLHTATNKDEKDKRKDKYYSIVLDESLHGGEEEYKL